MFQNYFKIFFVSFICFNKIECNQSEGPHSRLDLSLDVSNYYHGKFNGRLKLLTEVRDQIINLISTNDDTDVEFYVGTANITNLEVGFKIVNNKSTASDVFENYSKYLALQQLQRIGDYSVLSLKVKNFGSCGSERIGKIDYKGEYIFPDAFVGNTIQRNCTYGNNVFSRICLHNNTGTLWSKINLTLCNTKSETTQALHDLNSKSVCSSPLTTNCKTPLNMSINLQQSIQQASNITISEDIQLVSNILVSIATAMNNTNRTTEENSAILNNTIKVVQVIIEASPLINSRLSPDSGLQANQPPEQSILESLEIFAETTAESLDEGNELTVGTTDIGIVTAKPFENTDVEIISMIGDSGNIDMLLNENNVILDNFLGSIKIPAVVFVESDVRTLFSFAFKEDSFFFKSSGRVAQSAVIGASIGRKRIENLTVPIQLKFMVKETGTSEIPNLPFCNFWETSKNGWSKSGLTTITGKDSHIIDCKTNHLTNFALILDVKQTAYNPLALQIVTWIGCGISLAGLFLTIVSFSMFKRVRKKLVPKLLIFLSLSLSLTLIVFLAGAEKTKPRVLCQIIAGLIQYFVLSTFCWMAVEGYHLHRSFVQVFSSKISDWQFFKRAFAFAAGVPAIIVIITGVSQPGAYGDDRICMVRGLSFFISMLLPICVILIGNIIVLVLVLRGIRQVSQKAKKSVEQSQLMRDVRIAFACSMLLGFTWLFGVLAVGEAAIVFQWLFCIFNSLQGFFIFVFYALRNDELKKEWQILLRLRSITMTSTTLPSTNVVSMTAVSVDQNGRKDRI